MANKFFLLFAPLLLTHLLLSTSLYAEDENEKYEHESQPLQELFQTETVYPEEKGELQLTVMPGFNRRNNRNSLYFPVILEYGITDNWQVEVETDSYLYRRYGTGKDNFGIDGIEIGTKYSFMNIADTSFHGAVGFEIGIPFDHSNNPGIEAEVEYEPFLILALDIPRLNDLQLFAELRAGFGEEGEDTEFSWNTGFFVPFHTFCLTAELNVIGREDQQIYFTPGLVWNLPGSWELGGGVAIGLNDHADSFRVILALTYELSLFGENN